GSTEEILRPVGVTILPDASQAQQPEFHVAYALCSTVPWGVILQEPVVKSIWTVSHILRDISLWLAIALTIAILGGLLLSRMIGRPILRLTQAVKEIGAGNFDHRVPFDRGDEFGELAHGVNSMAQRLKVFDDINVGKVLREKSKLEAIVHNIADGVIFTGSNGEVLAMNEPVERWFGVRESECLNRVVAECVEEKELADLINETANDLGKTLHTHELSLEIPGTVHETRLIARAMRVQSDTGETVGVTTILRDVTVEREVDRMKTELLSIVAHELRSPLVSIMGFSGILLEKELDLATRLEFAETVNREANRMVEMLNKFLNISRIESGKTEFTKTPADVTEIVRDVVRINSGIADEKTIQIELHAPNRVTQVLVDRELIGQAVLNVLTNAVKYSPVNTTVRITVTEHRNTIEVAVKDEGFGITSENQKRLFEKFFRVTDDPNVRDITGTGLGLPLVKEIVEQHGGRVHVESTLGAGSTVSFHLPKNLV
ncbi:MAG TPA: HAMP domain-containing protein, partial [Firmicutes bacterium]|nr:HAMP domain-containing protein [Bacillota bacterium]